MLGEESNSYSVAWASRHESITGTIWGGNHGTGMIGQKTPSEREYRLTEGGITEVHDTNNIPVGGGRNRKNLGSVNEVGGADRFGGRPRILVGVCKPVE